jgi:hypothetical protein
MERFEDDGAMNRMKEEKQTALSNGQNSKHCPRQFREAGGNFQLG